MSEKNIRWTEQQRRAITQRGGDVLVTASAGTGKTAVLSGRCVDIVSDKSICPDVWSILVLTFTDAAAEQMRSRIAGQLRTAFLKTGDARLRQHLRYQLILLQGADISTIHSFCKRLITEYFYELSLDPTFRIIDSDEAKLLKAETLEKTIDWAWQQSNLRESLEQLLCRRDLRTNDGFLAKIITLSDFLDSVISRQKWYERALLLCEAIDPFATDLGKKQKQILAEKLQHILNRIRYAQRLYENENTDGNWARKWEETFVEPVVRYVELLKSGDWDRFTDEIRNYHRPPKFEYKPRDIDEPIAGVIKSIAESAKKAFEELFDQAVLNPDYLDKVSGSVRLQTKVLIELVKKFDQLYSQTKRAINCLDFADLEHYALELLTDADSSEDKLLPSETALALRRKYKYIFIDEYQDINPIQQAILDALSAGGNVFVVGDVKQSIYAFRGAEPEIFLKNLEPASADPKNAPKGLRVDLNANFRSTKGILDFVNKVFGRIMTASFTKIDYDESSKLKPAFEDKTAKPAKDTGPVVELHILDEEATNSKKQKTDSEKLNENIDVYSSRQRQAAMIAQRIKRMVGAEGTGPEFQIYDKQQDKLRDVEYQDIVILMRSPAKRINNYVEVLRLAGVPISGETGAGYFETTEISDLLCLLKVLDNPQRDIELAAVLRSPIFNVSDTELVRIRVHGRTNQRHKSFHNCVLEYCASGQDLKLANKLKEILAVIERWRTLARRGNLGDLIWHIYRQTGFLSFVSALPNGRGRKANLLKLHDRAIQFEGFASSSGMVSLSRFVEFIEELQEAGQDWASAEPEGEAENAIRIMSVHKSKGLEFPVVFLAELDSQFNKKDVQKDFLADAVETLGLQIIDRKSNAKLSSLAHQVIAERKLSTALAEEMRILYVATTRARERLILTSCEKKKKCQDIICNGFFLGGESISDWQLRDCKSHLDWILYGLSDQKNLHNAFETGLAGKARGDDLFTLEFYGQTELEQISRYIDGLKKNKLKPAIRSSKPKQTEKGLLVKIKKSLDWQYQFGGVSKLRAKNSVTQLTHYDDEYAKIDYSRSLERKPEAVLADELAETVEGRLIGTATHSVITQLDLTNPITKEAIEKTIEKLLADGVISGVVAAHIDTSSIIAFFVSKLGRMVLNADNTIWREWPFTFTIPASEFNKSRHERQDTSDEVIIVQGIIDMLVQTPQGLLVIDFKTDNITAEQVSKRAEFYSQQLELYSRAAGAIMKTEVIGRWLYFLTPGCAIKI